MKGKYYDVPHRVIFPILLSHPIPVANTLTLTEKW